MAAGCKPPFGSLKCFKRRRALFALAVLLLAARAGVSFCFPHLLGSFRATGRTARSAESQLGLGEDVAQLKVYELRERLRTLGLEADGSRAALVDRLSAALATSSGPGDGGAAPPLGGKVPTLRFHVNASVGHMVRVLHRPGRSHVVAVGDWTGSVTGLDVSSGDLLLTGSSGLDSITSASEIPGEDAAVLCGSGWTGGVSAFEPSSGQAKWSSDVGLGESRLSTLRYARTAWAQGAQLAVYGGGGTVSKVAGVDPGTGDVRWCIDSGVGAVWSLACSPDSPSRVLCGGSWTRPDHTAKVVGFDAATGDVLFDLDPGVGRYICTAFSDDGGAALCAGENGMVAALDPSTGDVRFRANASVGEVWSLAPAKAQGVVLCAGGWTGLVSALDADSGALRWGPVNATVGKVFSFALVPELGLALAGGPEGRVAGLDARTGELRFAVDVGVGEVWSLAYDAESRLLFCGGNNWTVAALEM